MPGSSPIEFTVAGGGGEIGASCFQLALNGETILLDCGIHPKKDGIDALPELALLKGAPDVILISHGHHDHIGAVPYLVKQFPSVRVHSTIPTVRIMDRMLHNSVSVMGLLARERGIRDYPLYDHDDVNWAMRGVKGHDFDAPFELPLSTPSEVSFHHAGHVLGGSSIYLKTPDHNIFYTGDICQTNQELLGGHRLLDRQLDVDTLIIESTHGNTEEEAVRKYGAEGKRLGERMSAVLNEGGVALVPAFALGRTQELLNVIARMQENGDVPDVPVYASGLGRAVYEIYNRFDDYLRPEAVLRPLEQFERMGDLWKQDVVERLVREPCIIVATSGMMMENTPSAMIAETLVQQEGHGIFFAGYLDPETLGYKLLHSEVGDWFQYGLGRPPVQRKLKNIERFYFSAHAPRKALQKVIDHLHPTNAVFVHGDPDALAWMKTNAANGCQAFAPEIGQTITLES